MISIQQSKEPFVIQMLAGITFTVIPLTSFDMQAARNKAQRLINDIRNSLFTLSEVGFDIPKGFDVENPDHIDALRSNIMIKELAITKIIGWSGIKGQMGDEDLPFNKDHLAGIFNDHLICDTFFAKLTEWHILRLHAKKEYGVGASGITVSAPNIAEVVKSKVMIALKDSVE